MATKHLLLSFLMFVVAGGSGSGAAAATAPLSFSKYCQKYSKQYFSHVEYATRQRLYEARVAEVEAHNALPGRTWSIGVNHMSDWTDAERRQLNGYKKSMRSVELPGRVHAAAVASAGQEEALVSPPSDFDWRDHTPSVLTAIKDQGACGSCWTFAAAETVESHYAIRFPGQLEALSEQQIASCPFDSNPKHCGGTGGCQGGTAEVAFQSIVNAGGLASEWTYPYVSYGGDNKDCRADLSSVAKVANVTSFVKLPENEYQPLIDALLKGPVAISVDASSWHAYEGGVYDGCNQTSPEIDHAVQLVGYGEDPKLGAYWTVRNSWGNAWGEKGFIRLRRTPLELRCGTDSKPGDGTGCDDGPATQHVCGTCGILFDTAYPIIGQ